MTTPVQRFWAKVNKTAGCWLWTAGGDKDGYGYLAVEKRNVRAHRFSYALAYGPIADDVLVLHHCDNPPCVRPEHLFIGDTRANAIDCISKGRGGGQFPKGTSHPNARLTEQQIQELRKAHGNGLSVHKVAKHYGINYRTAWNIVHRVTWSHVP